MDPLKLDAESVSEMKSFYHEELAKALRRLEHINKVLSQLGEEGMKLEINVSSNSKGNSAISSSTPKRKYKKKRGPKSRWDKVILKSLKKAGKPMTYDEITNFLMISEGRDPSRLKNTKATVQNTVFRLRKERKLKTFSMGSRIKYIGLKEWFIETEIQDEFKAKISVPKKAKKAAPVGKKRGPGRPPKKRGPGRPPKAKAQVTNPVTKAKKPKSKAKPASPKKSSAVMKNSRRKKTSTASSKKRPLAARKVAQKKTVKVK